MTAVGLVVVALAAAPACSVFNDCESGDPPVCESATTYARCMGGEGQYHRLEDECPPEQTCDASRKRDPSDDRPCFGNAAGGSCTSSRSCGDNLRCLNAVCTAPAPSAIALCQSATRVTLSVKGEWLDVDLPLTSDVETFQRTFGTTCRFGRVGLLHVTAGTSSTSIHIAPVDAALRPSIRELISVTCDGLFAKFLNYTENETCSELVSTSVSFYDDATVLIALAPDVEASTLRLRLYAE